MSSKALLLALGLLIVSGASAEPPTDLERRVERIEQENLRLKADQVALRLELEQLEKREGKAEREPLVGFSRYGFYLRTQDNAFQLRIRGVIQADGRAYFGQSLPVPDTFLIRRARPIIEGTVGELIDFRLLPDFGEGKLQLLDAFIDIRPFAWLMLRGGKFKTPFGLERLQEEQYLTFVERGLTSNLVPDRDIGVSLHGRVRDETFRYEIGVYDGTPDGANVDGDNNDGKDVVGRLFAHPFFSRPKWGRLGIGFGATWGNQRGNPTNTSLPTFRTAGQQIFFSYIIDPKNPTSAVLGIGERYRFSPQLYYYIGPFGLFGEYVYSAQRVAYGGKSAMVANQAWQLAAIFVLTLEDASYEGVRPHHPFNPMKRRFGALELAARYEELWVDPDAFPTFADPKRSARNARAFGVELNWYLTANVKFALLFERTIFSAGAPTGDRDPENALLGRLQVAF